MTLFFADKNSRPYFSLIIVVLVLLSAAGCGREEPKKAAQSEVKQQQSTAEKQTLPAASDEKQSPVPVNNALSATTQFAPIPTGHVPQFVDPATGKPAFQVVFSDNGGGEAYLAQISGALHVVHNGKVGMALNNFDKIVLSPDGRRVAYSAQVGENWRMVIDNKVGVASDEVGLPVFSPDNRHIAYAARTGEKWHMVLDNNVGPDAVSVEGAPVFSADSSKIVYMEGTTDDLRKRLVVSDILFKSRSAKDVIGSQMVVNQSHTRIAAVKGSSDKQRVMDFSFARPDEVTEGPVYESINKITFGPDGRALSYVAEKGGSRLLVFNGREESLPDGELIGIPVVRSDNKGVGMILSSKDVFFVKEAFSHNSADEKKYDEAADLVYGKDGGFHAYAARKGSSWFIVVNGKEGPAFERVIMPEFSPDNRALVYRARKGGKRFVVVADLKARTIRTHQGYEQVFPPVFSADGTSVAYGVKDGRNLIWKVEKL